MPDYWCGDAYEHPPYEGGTGDSEGHQQPVEAIVYITSFTADDDLNIKITNVDASKFQAYFAYKGKTSMNPLANPLVETGNTHSINPIFLMALAAWESGWGTSNYANTRCNYFGYGAVYSNPDKAWEFNSANECVDVVSRFIKCDYLLNSGTYSVLLPAGQVYNPSTKQDHKAPPYIEQTRNAGKYSNGPTLRGWIIKYNMNSQSEMNGILSIMNDFVSWHVETYGVGLEVYSGDAPSLGEQAASLAEAVVRAPYLWGGKGYDWKEGKFVESNDILHGYHWNWQDHSEVEKGVDCSGLVFWAFNKAAGATQFAGALNPIPGGPPDYAEGASGQWKKYVEQIPTSIPSVSDLNTGYLLFLDTNSNGLADHVGMYVGNGYVIHSRGGVGVENKTLNDWLNLPVPGGKYKDYFLGYGRVKAASGDKFNIGDIVRVTTNLNVRPEPGSSLEITDPDYPGYAPTGTIGIVLSGPSSADSYIWWEVDYGPGLYTGWSVEDWLEKVDDNIPNS